jgi:hypothetical protein
LFFAARILARLFMMVKQLPMATKVEAIEKA